MHQAQCFQHTGERSEAEGSRSFSLLVVLLHEPMPLKQQLGLSQKLFMSLLGLFLFSGTWSWQEQLCLFSLCPRSLLEIFIFFFNCLCSLE